MMVCAMVGHEMAMRGLCLVGEWGKEGCAGRAGACARARVAVHDFLCTSMSYTSSDHLDQNDYDVIIRTRYMLPILTDQNAISKSIFCMRAVVWALIRQVMTGA
jgi:hypothetical protein